MPHRQKAPGPEAESKRHAMAVASHFQWKSAQERGQLSNGRLTRGGYHKPKDKKNDRRNWDEE